MQEDLSDLYQEVILDHFKRPRHYHPMERCDVCQPGKNPLCGDELTIYLSSDPVRGVTASFEGHGCSISKASASIMVEAINGRSRGEVLELIGRFNDRIRGTNDAVIAEEDMTDLDALAGVRQYPVRIKCASLAWKALELALKELDERKEGGPKSGTPVSTEQH